MSWLTVRRIYQLFFVGLFFALIAAASFAQIRRFPVSIFLEFDPLIALATALSSHMVYAGTAFALVVVILTLLFGRIFCSWVCPLGILNHVVSALSFKYRHNLHEKNEWRPFYRFKYYLLIALLILAAFGSLQVGLFDPIALSVRSFGVTIFPSLQMMGAPLYVDQPYYLGGWFIGSIFIFILAANFFSKRLWCRVVCPLGALLGAISKFSLFRIHRNSEKCVDCGKCAELCHGACNPDKNIHASDCVLCLNCLYQCKEPDAIGYKFLATTINEARSPNLDRRNTVVAIASGAALLPVLRTSHGVVSGADHDVIRPPGALLEADFATKCIKCGACIRVCPTSVIQPAALQAGFEGLWTPILKFDLGFCTHTCTLCSQVCPTGAIAHILPEQRIGDSKKDPIKIGTAFFDRGRCLPWAMETPCIVCEEICPTAPKAIWLQDVEVHKRDGKVVKIQRPHLDPVKCIGCGACQFACPVGAKAAVRVSSVGETRSQRNRLLLETRQGY